MTDKNFKEECNKIRTQLETELETLLLGEKIPVDIINHETGEILILPHRTITKRAIQKLAANYGKLHIDVSPIRSKILEFVNKAEQKGLALMNVYEIDRA